MPRFAHFACATSLLLAAATMPVQADPIHITVGSGSIQINADSLTNGTANLAGTHGFTLTAGVTPSAGLLGPFSQCFVPECTPGSVIQFDLPLGSTSNFAGIMTIEGDSFVVQDSQNPEASLFMHFDGSLIAPAAGPSRVSLTAPFSMTGTAFAFTPLGGVDHDSVLSGRGIGTLTLVPFNPNAGFPPAWTVESLRFDFAQPTPEPSTLLLLGTCVAAVVRGKRARA